MHLPQLMIFRCSRKSSRPALRVMPLIATCTLIPHRSSDPISKQVKHQFIGYFIGLPWASAHKITDKDIRRSYRSSPYSRWWLISASAERKMSVFLPLLFRRLGGKAADSRSLKDASRFKANQH